MLGNYITVDGVSSRTLGLFCKQLPMWPVAVESKNSITVGGRLDNLYQSANHYNDIQIDIEAVLIGFDVDPIIRYLTAGKKIVLSNIPDRYGIIRQLVAIDQNRVGNGALELRITLKCSPFKYKLSNPFVEYSTSPSYFQTAGTIYSEPIIYAVGCSSGFTMSLNGVVISTTDITGNVFFDVPNRVVYKYVDNVRTVIQSNVTGNIWDLILVPSDTEYNELIYSNALEIQVKANERWL